MSAALDLVKSLSADGVEFSTDGGRIRWRNGDGKVTPEIVASLAAEKGTVIEFLSGRHSPAGAVLTDPNADGRRDEQFADQYARAREGIERQTWFDDYDEERATDGKTSEPFPAGTDKPRNKPRRHFVEPVRFDPVAQPDDLEAYAEALRIHGPMSYGMAMRILGWGGTRAGQVEAMLRSAGRITFNKQGRAAPDEAGEAEGTS